MHKAINVPNAMSVTRILMIPVIVYFILNTNRGNYPFLIGLIIVSTFLDFFDGYVARKLSQETELGKILDPLADKLLIICVVTALLIEADFPLWLAIAIIIKDISILLGGLWLMKGGRKVQTSLLIGKVTFGVMAGLILFYIIDLHEGIDLEILKRFFTILGSGFLIWSWIEYSLLFRKETHVKRS